MAVKIRFARIGKKHAPIYRIVAIDSRKKRDGMFLENLGTYNPKTKKIVQFDDARVAYWISVGAIVTDSVSRLISMRKNKNVTIDSSVAVSEKKSKPVKAKTVKKEEKEETKS